ncbi:MAG: XdhC family protein [Gloeobacteraceae cyanobacterium ES-bin-144]|nr:XdhC family protein [Verrucomicrobiales bacterium]
MDTWEQIAALRREGVDAVVITITAARGSVPGQLGAKAIVTAGGLLSGNLGGGKVEKQAVEYAVTVLGGREPCATVSWNLQQDVGMTCGGEMSFLFEKIAGTDPWRVAIFGAGHVSQALVPVLATLSCRIDVFDTRSDWLAKFAQRPNVNLLLVDAFEDGVSRLSDGTFILSITSGHSSDRPVLREALRRFQDPPFIGVIGSASKRAVLLRELREDGLDNDLLEKVICPLGLPIGGNDPAEIAISIVAQLLAFRMLL